jgi:hypothetical protein
MFFYCRHYNKQINYGKAKKYCFDKRNCWALKIFFRVREINKYIKKNKKNL